MLTVARAVLVGLAAAAAAMPRPAGAAETLRAVSALPMENIYTKGFMALVADVNRQPKGPIEVAVAKDDNAIAPENLAIALRDGAVDIAFGPVDLFAALVPEAAAIATTELKAMELRSNGGTALIDQIFRVRMNVHVLGLLNTGARLHVYLREAPKLVDDYPVLSGLRIAAAPASAAFVTALGATPVESVFPGPRAAVQSGAADSMIWPRVGHKDLVTAKRLNYRIDPGFAQIVSAVLVNLRRWRGLPAKARDLLTQLTIKHERDSYVALRVETAAIDEALDLSGLRVIALEDAAHDRFLSEATQGPWEKLKAETPTYAAQLERVFYRAPLTRRP